MGWRADLDAAFFYGQPSHMSPSLKRKPKQERDIRSPIYGRSASVVRSVKR
jgi:hypothetical protein